MKNLKVIVLTVLVLALVFGLAACKPFEGYDDDATIIKGGYSAKIGAVQKDTSSKYSLTVKKFNGVEFIKSITVSENPVFDMTLNIESGKFKVVLVKDGQVFLLCDANTESAVSAVIPAGTYQMKAVGEDANFKLVINW